MSRDLFSLCRPVRKKTVIGQCQIQFLVDIGIPNRLGEIRKGNPNSIFECFYYRNILSDHRTAPAAASASLPQCLLVGTGPFAHNQIAWPGMQTVSLRNARLDVLTGKIATRGNFHKVFGISGLRALMLESLRYLATDAGRHGRADGTVWLSGNPSSLTVSF